MKTIVLDFGHGPGSSKTGVIGACTTRNNSGKVKDVLHCERDLILRYGNTLAILLAAQGFAVRVMLEGSYKSRQTSDLVETADCYIALHVNASTRGSTYGLTLAEATDTGGLELADFIGSELKGLPGLSRVVRGCWADGLDAGDKLDGRIVYGVGGRYIVTHTPTDVPACLIEPFYVTASEHAELRTQAGLELVAETICKGIVNWFERE